MRTSCCNDDTHVYIILKYQKEVSHNSSFHVVASVYVSYLPWLQAEIMYPATIMLLVCQQCPPYLYFFYGLRFEGGLHNIMLCDIGLCVPLHESVPVCVCVGGCGLLTACGRNVIILIVACVGGYQGSIYEARHQQYRY